MTEKQLELLGFTKENIFEYEGETDPDYYYVYDVVDGVTFITPTSSEIKNDEWFVDLFNTDPIIRFYGFEEVQSLINKLTKAKVK